MLAKYLEIEGVCTESYDGAILETFCYLDGGDPKFCTYAKALAAKGKTKEDCPYWKKWGE